MSLKYALFAFHQPSRLDQVDGFQTLVAPLDSAGLSARCGLRRHGRARMTRPFASTLRGGGVPRLFSSLRKDDLSVPGKEASRESPQVTSGIGTK